MAPLWARIMEETLIPSGPLVALDYVGIGVFAVSGALLAAKKGQTLVTFFFFALVTGVGGGTLRDLLIGAPVFWVQHNETLFVITAGALAVWFIKGLQRTEKPLLWFDAVGLAAYSVYGASKALRYDIAPLPAIVMGVMTACVGGIIRDVLANEPSILMRPELYVTAAALSSASFVVMTLLGLPIVVAGGIAALLGFALRGAAVARGLSLPSYHLPSQESI